MKKILFAAVLIIAITGILPVFAAGRGQQSSGNIKAIFIAMDSQDEHWQKVKAGTEAKAKELGNIDISFNAPPTKLDSVTQLQMVEDAITKQVDILLVAPLNADAIVPAVEKAKAAGIVVVIIDSAANTDKYDAFLSTDNSAAAALAADEMAKAIGGSGKIAIINHQAGAGTTMARQSGFENQIKAKYSGITIVGTQYSDGDKTKALNIATDFMTANPDLAGIYATNEGSTIGAGNAIEQAGKAGRVKFVGFDWSADTKSLIERDVLNATMVQNPFVMGYEGLQVGVDVYNKKTVNKQTDTGVTVATKANAAQIDALAWGGK
ncbi:MAG: ABC transporter substrate-binding protein [Treponema sp.]|jgi:ribose transport system substrate-binding protein|nr:ABC transporter substrate-binding protein [Treponema sp.]